MSTFMILFEESSSDRFFSSRNLQLERVAKTFLTLGTPVGLWASEISRTFVSHPTRTYFSKQMEYAVREEIVFFDLGIDEICQAKASID